jgi:hypothetical protein
LKNSGAKLGIPQNCKGFLQAETSRVTAALGPGDGAISKYASSISFTQRDL